MCRRLLNIRLRISTLGLLLGACSAVPVVPGSEAGAPAPTASLSATEAAAQADALLAKAGARAAGERRAVVVLLHAEWCQPCNELLHRVIETHDGSKLLEKQVVLSLDFDDPVGGAVAAKLHVLGLPTTLVLRPEGGQLREFARVEGFEQPDTYRAAMTQALARTQPAPSGCDNADGRALDLTRPPGLLLTDMECLQMQLTTAGGAEAASGLHALLDDPASLTVMASWPEDARSRVVAVVQGLGRYDSRIAHDHAKASQLFGSFAAWPGTRAESVAGLTFWHARSLAKAGDAEGAVRVLDAYMAKNGQSPASCLLAADLLVTEHIALPRAQSLLAEYLRADPSDHWALYLAGDLAAQLGNREEARQKLQQANRLKPGVALYIRQYLRVSGDTTRQE